MTAILKLKRVKDLANSYMTPDEHYLIRKRDDSYWCWAVRVGTSPNYQIIDKYAYRTRKDCMYAVRDHTQEQLQEEQLWGE
jgi:hypothetical protein